MNYRSQIVNLFLIAALVMIIDLLVLQYMTLSNGIERIDLKQLNLLSLDVFFVFTLFLFVPSRFVLCLVFFVLFIFSIAALSYYQIFHQPISLNTILRNYQEGIDVLDFEWELFHTRFLAYALASLLLKVSLIYYSSTVFPLTGWSFNFAVASAYFTIAICGWHFVDPMKNIGLWKDNTTLSPTHGYLLTWLGEQIYLDNDIFLEQYVEQNRALKENKTYTDLLNPLACQKPEHVIVIQLESIDWRIIEYREFGNKVLDNFMRFAGQGELRKMKAIHHTGSSDADFAVLTNSYPSRLVTSYKLVGIDVEHNIATIARAAGKETMIVHPFRGSYYNRRPVIEKMGFDKIVFDQELKETGLPDAMWGYDDKVMFDYSLEQLNESPTPKFHFLITWKSHWPWWDISGREFAPHFTRQEIKSLSIWERYLISVNILDQQLGDYIDNLPRNSLIYIYGDHEAPIDFPGNLTTGRQSVKNDYVPFVRLQKGCDVDNNGNARDIHLLDFADQLVREMSH